MVMAGPTTSITKTPQVWVKLSNHVDRIVNFSVGLFCYRMSHLSEILHSLTFINQTEVIWTSTLHKAKITSNKYI